jgi:hypothetical protein
MNRPISACPNLPGSDEWFSLRTREEEISSDVQDSGASKELALNEESGVSLPASEPWTSVEVSSSRLRSVRSLNVERLTFPGTLTLGPGAPSAAADVIELGPEVAVAVCDHRPVVEGEVVPLLEGQVQRLQHRKRTC